jgi:hypothetical protein
MCKEDYSATQFNTRFCGPNLTSNCPNCGKTYDGKFVSFLVGQVDNLDDDTGNRFKNIRKMFSIGQAMDAYLNPEPVKGNVK